METDPQTELQTPATPTPTSSTGSFSKKQLLILIAALILFLAAIFIGHSSGLSTAKAKQDYDNVVAIDQALKYFYSDQDSYPSGDQFNNQQILVPMYMNKMPTPVETTGVCQGFTQFYYTQNTPGDFSLKFCLAKSYNGLAAGEHELTESELQ